ncbi:MAG: hypothetical protein ACOXZ2_05615 [Sphaerochaetaceae bacterium]
MLQNRGKILFLLILIALTPIFFLINCDPVGDYLIEIRGVTYLEGYIGIQLTPAYGGLRLSNFKLFDFNGDEIEISNFHLVKEKAFANYFLVLGEGVSLGSGWYTLNIEKEGFRFVYLDVFSEPNSIKLEVIE